METKEGEVGDPACWLDRVCDRCGALVEGPAQEHRCPSASAPDDDRPRR